MVYKVFVGGLAWTTNQISLRQAFEPFGSVQDAQIVIDRETGRSRGFGFVSFASEASAQAAIKEMEGALLEGRTLRVNAAENRRGIGENFQGTYSEPQVEYRRNRRMA